MLPTILTQQGIPLSRAITYQLVQAIGGVFGYTACSFWIDRYGRRPVLFLYYFIGAFFHLWFAMSTGMATFVPRLSCGWVNPGVYGSTGVYVGELHPTHIRATAVGWFFGIGRIGSFLVPTVVGIMIAYGLGAYMLHTFALSYLVSSLALWLIGVETRTSARTDHRARRHRHDRGRSRARAGHDAGEYLRRGRLPEDVLRTCANACAAGFENNAGE